ncbi:HupE/UreJ family protein [Leptospira saintgironsiae]|uniref:HupE/UreJ protein n=1 Tax=Leptospira saintgironsiae TaxID=2023183 RepID=A0A2M9YDW2_9LEPT|nr:HupE/UreJ family protein [Leptospira saintgironsiae]PJZ49751.1 HupE/UreJ protein [Leptospira saintgironsiae]
MKNFLLLSLFFSLVSELHPHNKSESFSVWNLHKNILSGIITIPSRETTRIPFSPNESGDPGQHISSYIKTHILVRSKKKDCELVSGPKILRSDPSFLKLELSYDCKDVSPEFLVYTCLFEFASSHLHYARLYFENGNLSENLFQSKRTEWNLKDGSELSDQPSSDFFQFVIAGMEHIGSGFDHIAFLLAILLAARNRKDILVCITGFTLGHSFTLSLAVLGKVSPESSGIEAFIGLTILIVAGEYVSSKDEKIRNRISVSLGLLPFLIGLLSWSLGLRENHVFLAYLGMSIFAGSYLALNSYISPYKGKGIYLGISTLAFGMIHGFGFAGFLLETGLNREHLFAPLFGFNLGVELGQLVLVGIVLVIGGLAKRLYFFKNDSKRIERFYLSILFLLSTLGTYWFVQRSF